MEKKPYVVPINMHEVTPRILGLNELGNLSFYELRRPTENGEYELLGYRGCFNLNGKLVTVEGKNIEEVLQKLKKLEL